MSFGFQQIFLWNMFMCVHRWNILKPWTFVAQLYDLFTHTLLSVVLNGAHSHFLLKKTHGCCSAQWACVLVRSNNLHTYDQLPSSKQEFKPLFSTFYHLELLNSYCSRTFSIIMQHQASKIFTGHKFPYPFGHQHLKTFLSINVTFK